MSVKRALSSTPTVKTTTSLTDITQTCPTDTRPNAIHTPVSDRKTIDRAGAQTQHQAINAQFTGQTDRSNSLPAGLKTRQVGSASPPRDIAVHRASKKPKVLTPAPVTNTSIL